MSDVLCATGPYGVPGASVNQPGAADAAGEGLSGPVHTVLHAQGSDAASCTTQSV